MAQQLTTVMTRFVEFEDKEGKRHDINVDRVVRVSEHNADHVVIIFNGDMITVKGSMASVMKKLQGSR